MIMAGLVQYSPIRAVRKNGDSVMVIGHKILYDELCYVEIKPYGGNKAEYLYCAPEDLEPAWFDFSVRASVAAFLENRNVIGWKFLDVPGNQRPKRGVSRGYSEVLLKEAYRRVCIGFEENDKDIPELMTILSPWKEVGMIGDAPPQCPPPFNMMRTDLVNKEFGAMAVVTNCPPSHHLHRQLGWVAYGLFRSRKTFREERTDAFSGPETGEEGMRLADKALKDIDSMLLA